MNDGLNMQSIPGQGFVLQVGAKQVSELAFCFGDVRFDGALGFA